MSDDEDLKAAIALSLADAIKDNHEKSSTHSNGIGRPPTGIAGLDRKAMEEERLARLAAGRKRERSISPPAIRGPRKAPRLEQTTVDLPSGARLNFSTLVSQDQRARKSAIANAATESLKKAGAATQIKSEAEAKSGSKATPGANGLLYPTGVIKRTWAFGHDRDGKDVKLEEVLEPLTLRTAVLSAFQWDVDWVLSKLKTRLTGGSTKCVFVMQAKGNDTKQEMLRQAESKRDFLRLCFPSMEGQINCMHSKLMLLFHAHKLRIAIPTANLLDFDWGEMGVMENSVFMIDLPRLPDGVKAKTEDLPDFATELLYFVEKQGLDNDVRQGILNFDFTATKNIAFVHTVGGSSYAKSCERTGFPGLGQAVRNLNLATTDLHLDFAASSIGSLNEDYLRNFHSAARGLDSIHTAQTASDTAKSTFFTSKPKTPKSAPKKKISEIFRIYFPTHDTVRASTAGAAGTICINRKYWENMPFPRACFRDYVSTRKGLLSHNKILYGRGVSSSGQHVAWVYTGSANMSESAWGKLVYDKQAKAWKINCRNWECGVLMPVPVGEVLGGKEQVKTEKVKLESGEDSETESEDEEKKREWEPLNMSVFDGVLQPPFVVPGREFEGREPWYFMEQQ